MDTATARPAALQRAVFEDALGKRHHAVATGGEPLEVLELREEFSTPAFESALRERVAALASLQNSCFARVHSVHRPQQNPAKLLVISERINGARLASVLTVARQQTVPLEVNATLCLIRQLVAAIALLHEKLPSCAHGAISSERIVVTPQARLIVVDHMLGAALEQLHYPPERYWKEMRVPMPATVPPSFSQRTDVMQIGALALELILGRPIHREEYPSRIDDLTARAWRMTGTGGVSPLPPEMRTWLLRALRAETPQAFASAVDAWEELERILGSSHNVGSFDALEAVMTEYARRMAAPAPGTTKTPMPTPRPTPMPAAARPQSPTSSGAASPAAARPEPAASFGATSPGITSSPAPAAAVPTPMPAPPRPRAEVVASYGGVLTASADTAHDAPGHHTVPEAAEEPSALATPARGKGRWLAAAALLLVAGGAAFYGYRYLVPPAVAEATGTLAVTTNPPGISVIVDGQPRGVTPLTMEVAPGAHELKLDGGGEPRVIPFTITPGSTVAQTIEMPKAAPATGQLMVRSEPSGARVTIDGVAGGTTPLTLDGLAPGAHSVTLANDVATVTQDVTIEAGITASLVVPMTAPQGVPVSGWIAVESPAEVQIFEEGRLLGTSQTDRIMVSAGRHDFDVVNDTLGYRATRPVTVTAGKVSLIRLEWPKGSMSLNAQPWAEVWVNGERLGETPIGNVAVPIGTHEVIFRHPQFGEQVVRTTVTVDTPARVSVDMRKR